MTEVNMKPHFVYDPEDWTETHDISDIEYLTDGEGYRPQPLATLIQGPRIWVVSGHWAADTKWFYSEAEAATYAAALRAKDVLEGNYD